MYSALLFKCYVLFMQTYLPSFLSITLSVPPFLGLCCTVGIGFTTAIGAGLPKCFKMTSLSR